MIEKAPILITGCPRSGSSMIASVVNICGAFLGKTSVKSMFTNVSIKNKIVIPYFDRMGVDVNGQFPLPDTYGLSIPMDWKKKVEDIIELEGYVDGEWEYKDSRSALIWRVWNNAFPDAKWLIVRRRTADVIQSCIKTSFMSAFKNPKNIEATNSENEFGAWLWYVHQYESKFVEMINNGLNCKIIWPERMLDGNFKQIHEVVDWLGLEWNDKAIGSVNVLLWGDPIDKERRLKRWQELQLMK